MRVGGRIVCCWWNRLRCSWHVSVRIVECETFLADIFSTAARAHLWFCRYRLKNARCNCSHRVFRVDWIPFLAHAERSLLNGMPSDGWTTMTRTGLLVFVDLRTWPMFVVCVYILYIAPALVKQTLVWCAVFNRRRARSSNLTSRRRRAHDVSMMTHWRQTIAANRL